MLRMLSFVMAIRAPEFGWLGEVEGVGRRGTEEWMASCHSLRISTQNNKKKNQEPKKQQNNP